MLALRNPSRERHAMPPTEALVATVPYRQEGEPEKHAAILRVGFNLDGLSDADIQVLGHLTNAADALNPIYRHQIEPRTFTVRRLIRRLLSVSRDGDREKLEAYQTVSTCTTCPSPNCRARTTCSTCPSRP